MYKSIIVPAISHLHQKIKQNIYIYIYIYIYVNKYNRASNKPLAPKNITMYIYIYIHIYIYTPRDSA